MTETTQLDVLLDPIRDLPAVDQLKFWRRFRAVHRRRIARTEAALCPELLKAVDDLIENLRARIAQGV